MDTLSCLRVPRAKSGAHPVIVEPTCLYGGAAGGVCIDSLSGVEQNN